MKVNQIASILNEVYAEIIGESALVAEDLSNIVDVGRQITATTQWADNFDNYVGKIIDKVGQTIFATKNYEKRSLGLWKSGSEYGSILEKIRVDVGDYTDNAAWQLTDSPAPTFTDLFEFVPATVSAKYFNMYTTFKLKISIPEYQVRSAFNSASEMSRFFDRIFVRVETKMNLAMENLEKRVVAGLVAEKIKSNNNVINLLADYKTESGNTTLTAATAMMDKDFLAFASKQIGVYRGLLREETMLFNDDGYVTHTNDDELHILMLTDFAKSLENTLYANTFHEQYLKVEGFREVGYWQGIGTSAAYNDRSSINVIPPSGGTGTGGDEPVVQSGIVCVMFDDQAAMVYNEMPTVRALPNPDGDFTNYWYKFKAGYFCDTGENAIVFVVADEATE